MYSDFEQEKQYTEEKETQKPIAAVHYRGYDINVYNDDYGQCYYFYFDGRCISCGAYNFDYEGCIHYEIDYKLDHIEIIHNDKPYHPSGSVEYMLNQETGERKKVLRYDGFVTELANQDGDYHQEVKEIMDRIDAEYDASHKDEKPRMFISDLLKESEGKDD